MICNDFASVLLPFSIVLKFLLRAERNLIASNQCWLHYKKHHTVKIFIAIRPQAALSYISKSWGSCNSDKLVTEDNDVLHGVLLQPGDLILADEDIESTMVLICMVLAEVIPPAFTNCKRHPLDVENTRKFAHVRIHIERIIGNLRQKYRIPHSKLPIYLVAKSQK